MKPLPLFPLGSVLVPGQVLPLHVFESRYLTLFDDLSEKPESERVFGIVAIRDGHDVDSGGAKALYRTGCSALVRKSNARDDGLLDVVVTGQHRFRLHGLLDDVDSPYVVGAVDELADSDGGTEADLRDLSQIVSELFNTYRTERGEEPVEFPSEPKFISYLVTVGLPLPMRERIELLSEHTTMGRLALALSRLRRERALFEATRSTPEIAVQTHATPN